MKTLSIDDLLKSHDTIRKRKSVQIDLFPLGEEMFSELDHIGMISRMKSISQLGDIFVKKSNSKNRFEYVMLQLWLHQKAFMLTNETLEYSYASIIRCQDLNINLENSVSKLSVANLIQIFTLVYNVGHCHNTFLSSRAMINVLKQSHFLILFKSQFEDSRAHHLIDSIIKNDDYHHFHLLNSLLVLEKCNNSLLTVKIAKELIYAYFNFESQSYKLKYVFGLFKKIRNLAITTFDLQLASNPFRIIVTNDKALKQFLREYLARYNDNRNAILVVDTLTKFLSASIYDEEHFAIKSYYQSKWIAKKIIENSFSDYYNELFLDSRSLLNSRISKNVPIDESCMKLTFDSDESNIAHELFDKLDHMSFVQAAIYNRHDGRVTIVVSTKRNQSLNEALHLRILKTVISAIRKIDGVMSSDIRYLIAAKFFLIHLLKNRNILINPSSSNISTCAYCVKGSNNRLNILLSHISKYEEGGAKHEVENMINNLTDDKIKDTSILIPSSIIVFDKNGEKSEVEFDGMVIHPYRLENQVVFLEAKETKAAGNAKKELKKKFDKLGIVYSLEKIEYKMPDAYYRYSIK